MVVQNYHSGCLRANGGGGNSACLIIGHQPCIAATAGFSGELCDPRLAVFLKTLAIGPVTGQFLHCIAGIF